jgi:hypothetical protein
VWQLTGQELYKHRIGYLVKAQQGHQPGLLENSELNEAKMGFKNDGKTTETINMGYSVPLGAIIWPVLNVPLSLC